jgi:hypothetical protein
MDFCQPKFVCPHGFDHEDHAIDRPRDFCWTYPLFLSLANYLSLHLVMRNGLTPFARHPGPTGRKPKRLEGFAKPLDFVHDATLTHKFEPA